MSTPQPSNATQALPRDARAPARVARASAEGPAVEESLAAHANRLLRARLTAAAVCVLDPGIAFLQWLRKAAGGVPAAEAGEGGAGPRKDRPGGRAEAGATAAEAAAPAPRRLRAFLVYVGVLLAGGMAGGALAFDLLQELIIYLAVENRQLEAALATQSKAAGAAKQTLEQAQAKRSEAERKLAMLRAEHADPAAAGRQDKLAPAATRPGSTRVINAQAAQPAGRDGAGGQAPPAPKTIDCSVIAGNDVSALMDCIHRFNR